jgi:hypothetical protein
MTFCVLIHLCITDDLVNPQGMVLNLSLRGHANTHNLESDIEITSTDKQLDKHEQIPPSSMDLDGKKSFYQHHAKCTLTGWPRNGH